MVDSKYNLIATLNHKPSKKNDGHYTAVNKSPTMGSWYKYDNDIVNLVKFVKGNTNSVLMDFQKTTSVSFYINVKYVSDCYNNLHHGNEVVDLTRQERPLIIVQLQDATSSLLLHNTSSLSLSDTLSLLLSNNSSRSLTSVRSKTNSDNDSLFPSSSQLTKNGKSNSSEIKRANYVFFILLQLGYGYKVRKCLQLSTSRTVCRKNVLCKNVTLRTWRMQGESAQYLSTRLARATSFRGESWWSNLLPTAQRVLPEICLITWVLHWELPELCSIKGKARSCIRRRDVCLGLLVCQKVIEEY